MTASPSTSSPPAPCPWWSDRWAWRGALAAGPLGALVAILYALIVLRMSPTESLLAYLLGAAVASGIGCLLLGPLGASVETIRHRRRTRVAAARPGDGGLSGTTDAGGAAGSGVPAGSGEQRVDARPVHPVAA